MCLRVHVDLEDRLGAALRLDKGHKGRGAEAAEPRASRGIGSARVRVGVEGRKVQEELHGLVANGGVEVAAVLQRPLRQLRQRRLLPFRGHAPGLTWPSKQLHLMREEGL